MSKHLVTGGAGFLGSALVRRLRDQDHEVLVYDRMSRGKQERLPADVRVIAGDVRDSNRVSLALAVWKPDVIWHLAYVQGTQTFYADPKAVISVALKGVMNVLDACEQFNVPAEFVLVSSSEAYQHPPAGMYPTPETVPLSVPDVTNPRYSYGGGKIASELAALAYAQAGVLARTMIVRPHNCIGPDMGDDHVVPQLARRVQALTTNELPIQGDGTATRCFNYVEDAVDGLMVMFYGGQGGEVYHLGDPREEVSIADLARRVAEYYGRHDVTIRTSELPAGSPTRRVPDISKLRALGYEPTTSLDDALELTLDWYWARKVMA